MTIFEELISHGDTEIKKGGSEERLWIVVTPPCLSHDLVRHPNLFAGTKFLVSGIQAFSVCFCEIFFDVLLCYDVVFSWLVAGKAHGWVTRNVGHDFLW